MSYPTLKYENCIPVLPSTLLGFKRRNQLNLAWAWKEHLLVPATKESRVPPLQAWLGPGTQMTSLELLSQSLGSTLLCVSFNFSRFLQCGGYFVARGCKVLTGQLTGRMKIAAVSWKTEVLLPKYRGMLNWEAKMTDLPTQSLFLVVLGFMKPKTQY